VSNPSALDDLNGSTTQFDASFSCAQGLAWLPWVGRAFPLRPPNKKLLVVGESHYFKGETPEARQADRDSYKDPKSTRIIVDGSLVNAEWPNKTFDTIPRLLFKTTEIERGRLWSECAYYNFVQRPMDWSRKERPAPDDYAAGWRTFAEVVRILEPSQCLFIGVTAANSFNQWIESQSSFAGTVCTTQKIGNTWARAANIKMAGRFMELIFVKHLGLPLNWQAWNAYLWAQHPDFLRWLEAEAYVLPAATPAP
jgi:hypothetical protein